MEEKELLKVIDAINMAKKACCETGVKFVSSDIMLKAVIEFAGKILIANSIRELKDIESIKPQIGFNSEE